MTTFEITTIVLLAIIAIMLLLIFAYMCWHFRSVESWQRSHFNELRAIRVNVATTAEYTQNHIAPDVELISSDVPLIREYINNCNQLLDKIIEQDSQDFRWGELSPEQQSEFMYRLTHPIVESPFKPPFEPTAQDAILNKPTDNANKSTNYNGYDPTMIVRGSETTDKKG